MLPFFQWSRPNADRAFAWSGIAQRCHSSAASRHPELALESGFPAPLLRATGVARRLPRPDHARRRGPLRLRRYFEAALSSVGVPQDWTPYGAAGIDHRTAAQYEELLSNLFVPRVDEQPTHAVDQVAKALRR